MSKHRLASRWTVLASLAGAGALPLGPAAFAQGTHLVEGETMEARSEDADSLVVVFEGFVLDPAGAPAEGAVVVSSAGGKAVADWTGLYRIETRVPSDADTVEITAVSTGSQNLRVSTSVTLSAAPGLTRVEPLLLALAPTCQASWVPTFGLDPSMYHSAGALVTFDDGSGPALYVGGVASHYVARWNGSSWTPLPIGAADVSAFTVFDDGSGSALYAGTELGVLRWNGASWTSVGSLGRVRALAVYDDGSGPALYAGLETPGSAGPSNCIVSWDGSSWGIVGGGVVGPSPTYFTNSINVLAVYDDGSGPALFAGGNFVSAGGVAASNLAKWNGSNWSALGSGTNGTVTSMAVFAGGGTGPTLYIGGNFTSPTWGLTKYGGSGFLGNVLYTPDPFFPEPPFFGRIPGTVGGLAVHDDGSGPALYVGGIFELAQLGYAGPDVEVNSIARFDGSTWSALGSGLGGTYRYVYELASFDDGSGPALYTTGRFSEVGGVEADSFARWKGSSWSALPAGAFNGPVRCMKGHDGDLFVGGDFSRAGGKTATRIVRKTTPGWSRLGSGSSEIVTSLVVYDDGSGPAVYAGKESSGSSTIDKWNGSTWTPVGTVDGSVYALAVHNDGSGSALFAGGGFTSAGGVAASHIARWNGSSWSSVGSGVDGVVRSLAVYNPGSGAALYAGGGFTSAGGVPANHIAKWSGSSWSALGSGIAGSVFALTVYSGGGGSALFAGGIFTSAGGVPANRLARWNGSAWTALGSGLNGPVGALAVSGSALYAGGSFTTAGGAAANRIARWNGSAWSTLGSGMDFPVRALTAFDDGGGPTLFAGGVFTSAGGSAASGMANWNGTEWLALDAGMDAPVDALVVHDGTLFVGGEFTTGGGEPANHVARWNRSGWATLGTGLGDTIFSSDFTGVNCLELYDDGNGPALFAGGAFTRAGSVSANRIAKWNGAWSALGTGMNANVDALAVFDDGSGPALYAGGSFTTAGGVTAKGIAKWNGSSWAALGSGMGGGTSRVWALAVYDDGTGPALYAGGKFLAPGGVSANNIAKWNGSSWASLGSGVTQAQAEVRALTVYDDGGGAALYVGGRFLLAGGVPAHNVGKWNGSSWTGLGSGIGDNGLGDLVFSLEAYDDGSGPALFAGGYFTSAGGVAVNHIARWNGSSWAAVGGGVAPLVDSLTVFDDGTGPALFVGGPSIAPDSGDSYLAKWGYGADATPPTLTVPPAVIVVDKLGTTPGETVSFTVTASDCQDPSPGVVCVPASGSFFPRGTTIVTCTATDKSNNQTVRTFPVVVMPKAQRHTSKSTD